jgi:hypothetical protein
MKLPRARHVRFLPRVRRTETLVPAAAVLGLAVAAVLAIPVWSGGGASADLPAGPPVRVALAELSPAQHGFADRVRATLDIAVDRRRVDVDTVRPLLSVRPYRVVSRSRSVLGAGTTAVVRYRLVLDCLTRACLPGPLGKRDVELDPTVVFYTGPRGKVRHVDAAWPQLRVVGRVSPLDLLSMPLAIDGDPLAIGPAYRHDPGRLAWLAAAASALLLLLAAAVVAPLLVRRRHVVLELPVEEAPRGLVLALDAVEASLLPPPADDRPQALDRLARELDAAGRKQLANRARLLAWRSEEIAPERVEELLEACRRALREAS